MKIQVKMQSDTLQTNYRPIPSHLQRTQTIQMMAFYGPHERCGHRSLWLEPITSATMLLLGSTMTID